MATPDPQRSVRDDRVLALTRWVSLAIIPFLVVAFAVLVFLRAFRAKEWHTVKGGFVPVGTFATLMGIATIAHWAKFSHTHVAFWLWAGLYFTTPFLVFWVFFANRSYDAPAADGDLLLICAGFVAVLAAVIALSVRMDARRAQPTAGMP